MMLTEEKNKERVLATVTSFLASVSNTKPPFTDALQYINPSSFCVVSNGPNLRQVTCEGLVHFYEALATRLHESGATSVCALVVKPGPDVWVYDDFAGVVAGLSFQVDGKEKLAGVNCFSLHRVAEGWKITALAATEWGAGSPGPPFITEPTAEVMAPIDDFFDCLKSQDWESMGALLLLDGGATLSRASVPLNTLAWPEFIKRLEDTVATMPKDVIIEEKIHNCEARIVGNTAFAWTPFTVEIGGVVKSGGVNIITLLNKDGRWRISGLQGTNRPVQQ